MPSADGALARGDGGRPSSKQKDRDSDKPMTGIDDGDWSEEAAVDRWLADLETETTLSEVVESRLADAAGTPGDTREEAYRRQARNWLDRGQPRVALSLLERSSDRPGPHATSCARGVCPWTSRRSTVSSDRRRARGCGPATSCARDGPSRWSVPMVRPAAILPRAVPVMAAPVVLPFLVRPSLGHR